MNRSFRRRKAKLELAKFIESLNDPEIKFQILTDHFFDTVHGFSPCEINLFFNKPTTQKNE